ncbi:hypothetical protein [Geodermatophilus sp. DF01-2]|uniref:hypothetical protein n=1 Tax=Geodermatophilus sp. DF01-2 TaxID=2559610 RepID=UPI001430EDF9|nr:hypothetical protein [Geodermatophilus sp. DF01_2]
MWDVVSAPVVAAGVARVSTGPSTQRVALPALQDAAAEMVRGGTLPRGSRALTEPRRA